MPWRPARPASSSSRSPIPRAIRSGSSCFASARRSSTGSWRCPTRRDWDWSCARTPSRNTASSSADPSAERADPIHRRSVMPANVLEIDTPRPGVRRLTMNRPEKRNALNNELRGAILAALQEADANPDVKVSILRGAGPAFSAGYDLGANNAVDQPYYTAGGAGQWARHVVDGWFRIWDLAKPVIAQVHGYCLAGGSELATSCDLVYVAEDARIGYPPTRLMSPPDNQFHPWLLGMRTAMDGTDCREGSSGAWADSRSAHPRPPSSRLPCSPSPSAWPSYQPSSRRLTSAPSTVRWRSWGCGPPSDPAPSCRRWPSRQSPASSTDASSSGTVGACASCSASATRPFRTTGNAARERPTRPSP